MRPTPFTQIVQKNLKELGDLIAAGHHFEYFAPGADSLAVYCFYAGNILEGKRYSYLSSTYFEKEAQVDDPRDRTFFLFRAALYRELAGRKVEADGLWRRLISTVRAIPNVNIIQSRAACSWIYEAYGLLKLERFDEVEVPALRGLAALQKGKGIYRAPHRNTTEFALPGVMQEVVAYHKKATSEHKVQAQKALEIYKKENVRYGRLGYEVIFDLQFSYPEIFAPVLPGPDPDLD